MGYVVDEIITGLAAAEDVDPMELDYALQDHVDVDAVESLLDQPASTWTLTFEVPDHTVTVTDDGVVLVDGERRERVVTT